jgi:DNA-binding transcriptional LysR family regulator
MQGVEQLFIEQGVHKQLTVGCTKTIGNYLLPDMLSQFERDEGGYHSPMIANTQVISRMLKNSKIDAALLEGLRWREGLVVNP